MHKSMYKGSPATFALIKQQIAKRFGNLAADSYDPNVNCFTLKQWNARGYRVKKGEEALKSFTLVEQKDEDKKEIKKWRKTVYLFFHTQVEEIKSP